MPAPEISVLVPVYNAQNTIRSALESLCRQTFADWECVLCDDGSSDATVAAIEEYARRDPRIRLFRLEHRGIVEALNWGKGQCRGRYVARFDADDLMHRERLQIQLDALRDHPDWAGVGCQVRLFPRKHLKQGSRAYEGWLNGLRGETDVYRDRFIECPLAHPTLFLRREVLAAFPYRDMSWPEDYDLVLRLLGAGQRLATVPQPLLFWRDAATRLSRNATAYGLANFARCRAHFLATDWLAGTESYILWGYGNTGRRLARALEPLGKRPSAIVEIHAGRIGQRIFGAPVIAVSELLRLCMPRDKMIVSVAGQQPRSDVRKAASALGLVEGTDFVCAA